MKNKHLLWLVSLPLLWVAGCATDSQSSQWKDIGVTEQGSVAYAVDKNSIKRDGQKVTFRSRAKYIKVNQLPVNLPAHDSAITTWMMDCDSGKYRPVRTELLDKNGVSVYSSEIDNAQYQPAPSRETAMYRQRQFVCKK
ncbi:MAG: hypothetical protein II131_05430 [Neisseriaceae bacterium]|nr:hypothetical protein [Neisseriaceae bacterium]